MKLITFSTFDKYKLLGLCIKSVTGIVGANLVLSNEHPYITLAVLAIGAVANEILNYVRDKETTNNTINNNNIKK